MAHAPWVGWWHAYVVTPPHPPYSGGVLQSNTELLLVAILGLAVPTMIVYTGRRGVGAGWARRLHCTLGRTARSARCLRLRHSSDGRYSQGHLTPPKSAA